MTKKDGSRFDSLFSVVRSQDSEPIASEATEGVTRKPSKQQGKSADPNYARTTIYLPKQLHKQLKSAAMDEERDMSDIVAELVGDWLKARTER